MDDLFIDRHKSELRAGITHHHHRRRRIDQVVRREREWCEVGEGGQTFKDTFLDREQM